MTTKRNFIPTLFLSCLWVFATVFSTVCYADLKIQEFDTKKKIHVIYVNDPSTDLTTVTFAFKGAGAATDPQGKEGLTTLMAHLLMERSKEDGGLDKRALDKQLKSLGVLSGISYSVGADNIAYSFKAPTEKLKDTFDVVKIIFDDQRFDAKELNKMQSFDPPEARLATASERGFASKILINNLFQGHSYANPAYGTLDGRQSITLNDVDAAAKQKFTRKNLVFAVIGNLPVKTLSSMIDNAFGNLPETSDLPKISEPTLQASGQTIVIPKSSAQSGVMFGQAGIAPNNPDYLPFLVLNDIIGGKPFTSRLWQEIRENRGLVYDVQTDLVPWDHAALLMGGFESENSKVTEVIDYIRKEWKAVQTSGVTIDEFKSSRTGLLGGFVLNFTTPDGIASYLLTSYLNGLPVDYINKRNALLEQVTIEDVNRVAKKYLNSETLTFVVVGEPSSSDETKSSTPKPNAPSKQPSSSPDSMPLPEPFSHGQPVSNSP